MFHIDDSEKPGRKAALKKLMDLMSSKKSEKLAGIKGKPVAAEMSVTELPKDGLEPDGDEGADGGFCAHCGKPR